MMARGEGVRGLRANAHGKKCVGSLGRWVLPNSHRRPSFGFVLRARLVDFLIIPTARGVAGAHGALELVAACEIERG